MGNDAEVSDLFLFHANVYANILDSQSQFGECLPTYPPDPLPLSREGGSVSKRGVLPLSIKSLPLSFKGEGDKGVRLVNTLNLGKLAIMEK